MVNNTDHYAVFTAAIKNLLVCGILTLAIYIKDTSIAMGLFLGGIASLLNYRLMISSTERLFDGNVNFPLFFGLFYLLRLLITVLVLMFAIRLRSINLFTAVLGLMWVKISIFIGTLKVLQKND